MRERVCFFVVVVTFFVGANGWAGEGFYEPLPEMKYPTNNSWSSEKEELGKMLYFDPRLSGSNWISCATCHNPALGFSDSLPRAIGNGQNELGRHSPTIINSGYFKFQFWDGRAATLEEQAVGPIQAAGEMDQNMPDLIKELNGIPGYVSMFKEVFGSSGITSENIGKAIATFERTVVSKNAPYDRYWAGDKSAMRSSAVNGMNLFFGKARCSICHNGPAFTDNQFHNIGIKQHGPWKEDLGRFNVTRDSSDKGEFKTPGLRHISRTAPYMHDGSEATLEDVVDFYNRGGDVVENKSSLISPLGLSPGEKKDLVEFMKALEGELAATLMPQLP